MIKQKTNPLFSSEKFKSILKANKVKRIAIFGSYATGLTKENSDFDFLVEFEKGADLLDQVGLKLDLEKLFRKDVDVVTPNALSAYIRKQVLNEAVYLWKKMTRFTFCTSSMRLKI